ncbi:sensor histidine kinase [Anoxynatronum buryatiense]|uniref:Two-component system, sensor histidine kinase YesM n=1 Tax=Anoxynatronum buryatiense TaxID=489973 RepID=A0AA45WX02_9CLOT|nr:histidine kinase [Anoxynatronum buryatiense]SMP61585.1 two-component system, sensor histidine kinase YesM [Anoxynatronum buryatiense]
MRYSIKAQMITVILLTFAILLTGYLYVMNQKIKADVSQITHQQTSQLVDARANQISHWIEQRKIEMQMMADHIINSEMSGIEARDYINETYVQKNDHYLDMGIVKYGGYQVGQDGIGKSIAQESHYREALLESARFKLSRLNFSEGKRTVTLLYRVGGVNRDIEFLFAEISMESILRIIGKIKVYDGVGELMIRGEPLLLGEEEENLKRCVDECQVFQTEIQAARGWSLKYFICQDNMNGLNHRIRNSLIIFGILVSIIMSFLTTLGFKTIIQPIEQLEERMKQVEKGDLTVRLETRRQDEIGRLIGNFNGMVSTLDKMNYQEKEMRLRIMQEQIKPHFLYNTLDTIKWIEMEENTEEVVALIDALSSYFRIGLSGGKSKITMDQEMEHADSYLQILKVRYEDRLNYTIHYDESLLDCLVIRVLLQPLIENAVIHGVAKKEMGGEVMVNAVKTAAGIELSVTNDAQTDPETVALLNQMLQSNQRDHRIKGMGLYNVNHRIRLEYGEVYGIRIVSENGQTRVVATLPEIRKGI